MSELIVPPKRLSFSDDPMIVEFQSGVALDKPNLTCSVEIRESGSPDIFHARLSAPYRSSGRMTVDLSDLFEMDIPLPNSSLSGSQKHHYGTYRRYKIIHGDRYGDPPITQGNQTSDEFTIVRGSSPEFNGFGPDVVSEATPWYLCHSYMIRDHDGFKQVRPVVAPDQTILLYIYCNAGITINYTVDIETSSGLSDQANGSINAIIGLSNAHLSLNDFGSAFENIIGFDITLEGGGKQQTISFIVDDAVNDYARIFLYENGCGGMETIRLAGRHERGVQVSAQNINTVVWSGFNHAIGQYSGGKRSGNHTLIMNTGYYPREYIQHLEQIMYSDLWYWDDVLNKFYRYTIEQTNMKIHDDQAGKYNLSIPIRPAWERTSANQFY